MVGQEGSIPFLLTWVTNIFNKLVQNTQSG